MELTNRFSPAIAGERKENMLTLKYTGQEAIHNVKFSRISANVVQVLGDIPFSDAGFTLSREGKNDPWGYPEYTTLYREVEGGLQFSNDGSVYVEPVKPDPVPEEPYIPTLEEVKTSKIAEMETMKQAAMDAGINVTLADGSTEHFTLADKEQKLLMALQVNVAAGEEKIPWHTSDETEHCKYYSNEDMKRILAEASLCGTYHETYIRDLLIYINSLEDKESVESVYYGMVIPEGYRSVVLQDMYAGQQGK